MSNIKMYKNTHNYELEKLKFFIEKSYNVKCHIINNNKYKITILVENLKNEHKTLIPKSINEYFNHVYDIIIYDKQNYIDNHLTITLTKKDLSRYYINTPFFDVTLKMFSKKKLTNIRNKQIKYRLYTDNPDLPYITKIIKSINFHPWNTTKYFI